MGEPPRGSWSDRLAGCLLGGALGDALGGRYEGQPGPLSVAWRPPLRLSDDTQLTMATCEAIIERGGPDAEAIAAAMARWHREGKVTGLGAATRGALDALVQGGHWALVGRRGEMAAGNGAAMRVAPLAFFVDPDEPEGRQIIRDVSRVTHHSDEAYAGALAVVIAVREAAFGRWRGGVTLLADVAESLPDSAVRDRLVELAAQPDHRAEVRHLHGDPTIAECDARGGLHQGSREGPHSAPSRRGGRSPPSRPEEATRGADWGAVELRHLRRRGGVTSRRVVSEHRPLADLFW